MMDRMRTGANGPFTTTLLTLLVGLSITAPSPRSDKEHRSGHQDYADLLRAFSPAQLGVQAEVGINEQVGIIDVALRRAAAGGQPDLEGLAERNGVLRIAPAGREDSTGMVAWHRRFRRP